MFAFKADSLAMQSHAFNQKFYFKIAELTNGKKVGVNSINFLIYQS